MSKLRPQLLDADPSTPCMTNGTAYLMILSAVQAQGGLIHGALDDRKGAHCAIGSYFAVNHKTCLQSQLIDEIAAVNDSVPNLSEHKRKLYVARWLRWKLSQLGMPGYSIARGAPVEVETK